MTLVGKDIIEGVAMTPKQVKSLYDPAYAAIYNQSFLLGPNFIECTKFEESLVGEFLNGRRSWLDVACGTGHFLSRFPGTDRAGLDLSPAMLDLARKANPGVQFVEDDFRNDRDEWHGRWDFVSCMWYAYCYAGSIPGVAKLIRNLAKWTSPKGICFLPVCDPDVLCKVSIPHTPDADSDDGHAKILGLVWEWTDEALGRRHENLIAPHLTWLRKQFEAYFSHVELRDYPEFESDCMASRKALIATRKLPTMNK